MFSGIVGCLKQSSTLKTKKKKIWRLENRNEEPTHVLSPNLFYFSSCDSDFHNFIEMFYYGLLKMFYDFIITLLCIFVDLFYFF